MESDIYGSTSTQKTENQYSPTDMYANIPPNSITADKIYSLNGLDVGAGQFTVDANGNVTFAGTLSGQLVNATNINSLNGLNVGNGNLVIDGNGNITLKGSISSGSTITGATITASEFTTTGTTSLTIQNGSINSSYNGDTVDVETGQVRITDSSNNYINHSANQVKAQSGSDANNYAWLDRNGAWVNYGSTLVGYTIGTDGYANINGPNGLHVQGTLSIGADMISTTGGTWIKVQSPSDQVYLQGTAVSCTQPNTTSNYVTIYASGVSPSNQEFKKHIIAYTDNAESLVNSTPVYNYQYTWEQDGELPHIGILMQQAPSDIVDPRGVGIDLYSMVSLLWKMNQELSVKVKALELGTGKYAVDLVDAITIADSINVSIN